MTKIEKVIFMGKTHTKVNHEPSAQHGEYGVVDSAVTVSMPTYRSTNEALAYLEAGRVKGKVVVNIE